MLIQAFAAFIPFVVLFSLILYGKKTVLFSALWTLLVLIALLLSVWGILSSALASALLKSFFVTFDIVLILIGAMFFMTTLKEIKVLSSIKQYFVRVSPDKRIQAILVAFFFIGLIEGLAGFGTPAILAAPLLILLGFSTKTAIILALLGNTVFVPFGAVGTPVIIGVVQGLEGLSGYTHMSAFGIIETVRFTALMIVPLALTVPLIISCTTTYYSGVGWRKGLEVWKQALLAGICMIIPYLLTAMLFGPEFPSLLGSLVGAMLFILVLRLSKYWNNTTLPHENELSDNDVESHQKTPNWFVALPYIIVVTLLIVSRLDQIPLRNFLQVTLGWQVEQMFNIPVQHSFLPFYSPGLFLLIGSLSAFIIYRVSPKKIISATKITAQKLLKPSATLFLMVFFTQLLLFSKYNTSSLDSIPIYSATLLSKLSVSWILVAPFVGLFGALTTGSATVSNLLFSSFQAYAAQLGSISISLVLALQITGAAVGNMIALHNIVAVLAVTEKEVSEESILLALIKPALIFALLLGFIGTIFGIILLF